MRIDDIIKDTLDLHAHYSSAEHLETDKLKDWLEKNKETIRFDHSLSKRELLSKLLVRLWLLDELEALDEARLDLDARIKKVYLDKLHSMDSDMREQEGKHVIEIERHKAEAADLLAFKACIEEKDETRKRIWKKKQEKGTLNKKQAAEEKLIALEATIKEIIGQDSGMPVAAIARAIERQCEENKVPPPYSCKADKNGRTSLMRNIEKIYPAIRKEMREKAESEKSDL